MENINITQRQNALLFSLGIHLLLILLFVFLNINYSPKEVSFIEVDIQQNQGSERTTTITRKSSNAVAVKRRSADETEKTTEVPVKLPVRKTLIDDEQNIFENSEKVSTEKAAESIIDESIDHPDNRNGFLKGTDSNLSDTHKPFVLEGTADQSGAVGELPVSGGNDGDIYQISWEGGTYREVLYQVIPEFPDDTDRSVEIDLKFSVNTAGEVIQVIPLKKEDPKIERITIAAFSQWRFSPSTGTVDQWGKIKFMFVIR